MVLLWPLARRATAKSVLAAAVTELDHFGLGGEMPVIIRMAGHDPIVISDVGTAPALAAVSARPA